MKLTFLGTGTSQGIPVIACNCEVCRSVDFHDQRLRTSVLIEYEGTNLLIDTGPDFRQQMLVNRVKRLDAVLYTHEHKDHTAGLDDIRSYNFKQKMDMPLYGRPSVLDQLKRDYAYMFTESKYPGVASVTLHEIENKPFTINQVKVQPIEVMHYQLPVYGYRIGDMAYITDAKTVSNTEREKLKDLDVLVINALQKKSHISHLTLEEAIQFIADINPRRAYITHVGHYMGLHKDVQNELPENVYLAYDGLILHG
ncbi:phosphoribosyl 1,2-cyclic phosphate phosphodiesterase [Reichenbachiella faecimaris]|uniref:Phosphoribosyl 1,2-cyclic phosphate phosphodiesterase n=1 Tax=Reichenbachiella faecimaris TaxID=692418 RepID=A0A1W2G5K1_REIFA|nr:MBL fold metallo-hydrolase [Reichenbachiella faecimaris]SMD31871.1 phosphoribosyl 1,2-cyclic phosphate phosphodiesterase [Reichenbachiella faecimaris]